MITLIKSPFIEYKMTILRNKKTSNSLFRQTMNEISYLIASEVLKFLPYKKVNIQTPISQNSLVKLLAQQIITSSNLKSWAWIFEGFVKFLPDAEKDILDYRDEQTYKPVEYLFKLPKVVNKKIISS